MQAFTSTIADLPRKRANFLRPKIALLLLFCSSLVGCGGGGGSSSGGGISPIGPATPSPVSLSQYYYGTETNGGASAPVALSVTQNGSQITGTWGNQFGGFANVGTLTGTVQGTTLSATLTSSIVYQGSPVGCPSVVTATVSGSAINGTFATTTPCTAPQSGAFSVQTGTAPPVFSSPTTGSLVDTLAGKGSVSATFSRSGVIVTGSYSSSFSNGTTGTAGQVYAVVIGSNLYLDLLPAQSNACPFSGIGSISGLAVSGNYTAQFCSVSDGGTFTFATF